MGKHYRKKLTKKEKRNERAFYAFISPFLIGFGVFTVIPMFVSLFFSFNKISVLSFVDGTYKFIGFDNYISIFKDNNFFLLALKNTIIFAISKIALSVIISLAIALLLTRKMKGRKIFRTLIYAPSVIPIVGAAIIWRQLFDGRTSILSWLLSFVGITIESSKWLGQLGLLSAIIMSVVTSIGPTMIMLIAALQQVPSELLEASEIEGANAWQKFIHITIPCISSVMFYLVMTGFISGLQAYAEVDLLIGSLQTNSMTLSQLVMFYYDDYYIGLGYSSALAWLIFLVIGVLSIFVFTNTKKMVFFQGGDEL